MIKFSVSRDQEYSNWINLKTQKYEVCRGNYGSFVVTTEYVYMGRKEQQKEWKSVKPKMTWEN